MEQATNPTVTIFGGGEIGSCLSRLLANKGKLYVWDKQPERRNSQEPLAAILGQTQILFLAIPSTALAEAILEIKPVLPASTLVVCLSKGLLPKGQTTEELIRANLSNPIALLAGPMLAEELNANLRGFGVVASTGQAGAILQNLFAGTNLYLESCQDTRSVAYASALKNIYAVLLGLAESVETGQNWRGFLTSKVFEEWEVLAKQLELDLAILWGRAGVGDFIATAFSVHSKNRAIGEKLASEKTVPGVEGTHSLKNLGALLKEKGFVLPPLLELLDQAVFKQADVPALFSNYLASPR